jgi:hypothetical protein
VERERLDEEPVRRRPALGMELAVALATIEPDDVGSRFLARA